VDNLNIEQYNNLIKAAIGHFWDTRNTQTTNQLTKEIQDTGNRSAVTGGKQLDGFLALLRKVAIDIGVPETSIYLKGNVLPGFFRPTKDWDILIITPSNKLISVVELKSQVGSFGNNFNNRTEEAIGSAVDLWTAYRENAFPNQSSPWLGYLMLVERSDKSTRPIKISEPYFKVFPEFKGSSYLERYRILCKRLMLERHYSNCCLFWTQRDQSFGHLDEETSIIQFLYAYSGHLISNLHEFDK
tara:strand:+ start:30686 stop:31414 length:729 start_codon:yes stop_codon:yes gene_type:complete